MRMLLHERDPRHHRRAAEGLCLRGRAGDQAAHRPVSSVGGPKPTLSDRGPSCLRRARLPAPLRAPEPSGCAGEHAETQPCGGRSERPSTGASPPYGSLTAARPDGAPRFGPNRSLRASWRERGAGLTALPPPLQVPATQRSAAEAGQDATPQRGYARLPAAAGSAEPLPRALPGSAPAARPRSLGRAPAGARPLSGAGRPRGC